jgi:hypothetical protein
MSHYIFSAYIDIHFSLISLEKQICGPIIIIAKGLANVLYGSDIRIAATLR